MANQDRLGRALAMRSGNTNIVELNEDYPYTLEVQADRFFIVDPTTKTKRIAFDASGIPAATDVTANRRRIVSNAAAVFATPTVLTSADSGTIQLCNKAAGIDFTLPTITASNIGMEIAFKITVEVTSNSYRWTANASDLMLGQITITDKDMAEGSTEALQQIFRPNGTTENIITIAGADDTTGSLVGGELTLTALDAATWWVSGSLVGDGSLATVFSAPA